MFANMFLKLRSAAPVFAAATAITIFLGACGANVTGVYSGNGESFFEKLALGSGGKVQVTFMGMTKDGTYEVDGKQVKVSVGGESQIFTIDDKGCLRGGAMIGTYCKDGATAMSAAKSSGGFASGPTGIYQAGDANDGVTLDFRAGGKVLVRVSGDAQLANGTFVAHGNQITVTVPGGMPINLTNQGYTLVGSLGGQSVKFVKK